MDSTAAIVLAGGTGSRVQRDVNKVYLPIRRRPLLSYPLETFNLSDRVDRAVVVVRDEDREQAEPLVAGSLRSTPYEIVTGGATRHQSEHLGLEAMAADIEDGSVRLVAIHDGARPFLTVDLLDRVIDQALDVGGAIPCLPIEAPVFGRKDGDAAFIEMGTLYRAQTPQAFRARELLSAFRAAEKEGFTGADTAETVKMYSSLEIAIVDGDPRNLKVTFVEDFFQAEELALSWHTGRFAGRGARATEG